MSKFTNRLLKKSINIHRYLIWIGAIALTLFLFSAFMHPLMIWTGPRATSFFPPQTTISSDDVAAIPVILGKHKIEVATIVKIVPSESGPLLQISQSKTGEKRYFDPKSLSELTNFDRIQAIWLARFYTGFKETPITDVEIIREFSNAYPWVNRLLPVYKISFDTQDNRTVFVHTETSAMASMSNDWKSSLQTIFQRLHTWNWLDNQEYLRLIAMIILLVSIVGIALTGTALVFLMKRRKIVQKSRRFHRYLAYAIWLPLLAISTSGSFHLIMSSIEGDAPDTGLEKPLSLSADQFDRDANWINAYASISFNAMSLVEGPDKTLYYRLGIPSKIADEVVTLRQHFDGLPMEKGALYVAVNQGTEKPLTDKNMAIHYARALLEKAKDTDVQADLITRFGPEYDFRNKRLPVWKIVFADAPDDLIYIDPVSGTLVDRMTASTLFERYAFSWLHKWDFIVPWTGRMGRDALVVLFLFSVATVAGFGMYMRLKPATKKKKPQNTHTKQPSI